MRRVPQLGLAVCVLALTACNAACTPPDAKNPDANDDGKPAPAADKDKKSAEPSPPRDMITEAKGVDLSKLSESQRNTFFQIINTEPSACGKPHSMAKSLRDDDECRDSLIAAQFVADRLAGGASTSQVKDEIEFVVASLQPREIPTEGRPVYGSERAPVEVVVFADFQCPHCKAEVPVLRKAVDQFRGRAKLVFKHFPLSGHPRAKQAALATAIAHKQGKFWEMHDKVFANPDALQDEDLMRYAQQIDLDMTAFRSAYEAGQGMELVEADRKHGEELEIGGTPAVFVNGRFYNELLFGGSVTGWIDDALKR